MFKTLKTLLRAQFLVYHLFGLVLVQQISQHRAGKIQRVAPYFFPASEIRMHPRKCINIDAFLSLTSLGNHAFER